jgi:hypothetical protein
LLTPTWNGSIRFAHSNSRPVQTWDCAKSALSASRYTNAVRATLTL